MEFLQRSINVGDIPLSVHFLMTCQLSGTRILQNFKYAAVFLIYKRKGNRHACGNYRGISLILIADKVLGKVILQHMKPILDSVIPEAQCGFHSARSTIGMIFTIRQLQEKTIEKNMPTLFSFIDFTKAFDTVNRQCLWSLLHLYGCPPGIISLTDQFHTKPGQPNISLNGSLLKNVEHFTCLGSSLSIENNLDKETERRISAASTAFDATSRYYRESRCHISDSPLKISWRERTSNSEVKAHANMPSVEAILTQCQFTWTSHVIRMDDSRLPKAILCGELKEGRRGVGRPKLRYNDH
ncbi:uncharacterized protein LOC119578764 [Penaeus monodon]|uniref:uncharacterized protein LOC119578764 n=1 Tax=Penaeus monodon TaxID=6687 RepID=UPI0018A6EC54|nr:uncharacterized protein LOC119578764 [Penaeus monodon]